MERVLIVDDMRGWVDIAARTLAKCEEIQEVRTAISLEEAKLAIEAFGPTVVVTDLRLSLDDHEDLSGLQICRFSKARDPDVGLVVLSGHRTPQLVRSVLAFGAEFLDKATLTLDQLPAAVLRAAAR